MELNDIKCNIGCTKHIESIPLLEYRHLVLVQQQCSVYSLSLSLSPITIRPSNHFSTF